VVKIWITPGRGGFGVSDRECDEPCLYALVTSDGPAILVNRHLGWKVTPSPVEPPTEYQANLKASSAMQHVLCQLEAEARGFEAVGFGHMRWEGSMCKVRSCQEVKVLRTLAWILVLL
jgi:hypothetical protein